METRRFTHINEEFRCDYCGTMVPPLKTGCRNHCPKCLSSKHVDVQPGDRKNLCYGELKASGYEFHKKKGLMILQTCQKCSEIVRIKAAIDDPIFADDYEAILRLTPDS